MLKLSETPPVFSAAASRIEAVGSTWCVAHTKSRAEKQLAWDLHRRDIPYFLPMTQRVTFSGGRKRRGMMPLFPGYCFVAGGDEGRLAAMMSQRTCQVLAVDDQGQLVRELSDLQVALDTGVEMQLHEQLPVGSRCRVTQGPFQGLSGVVIHNTHGCRLILQVDMLGQGASVEIDADLLERIETHPAC